MYEFCKCSQLARKPMSCLRFQLSQLGQLGQLSFKILGLLQHGTMKWTVACSTLPFIARPGNLANAQETRRRQEDLDRRKTELQRLEAPGFDIPSPGLSGEIRCSVHQAEQEEAASLAPD